LFKDNTLYTGTLHHILQCIVYITYLRSLRRTDDSKLLLFFNHISEKYFWTYVGNGVLVLAYFVSNKNVFELKIGEMIKTFANTEARNS